MEPVVIFVCIFGVVCILILIAACVHDLLLIRKNVLYRRAMAEAECMIVKPTEPPSMFETF